MSYKIITAPQLAALMKASPASAKQFVVVDARDGDFEGGNIVGAVRDPSEIRTDQSVSDLVNKFHGVNQVIFHCALSQVRGPKAAKTYARELAKQNPTADTKLTESNPYEAHIISGQEVLVLEEGFSAFQSLYRNDPELVERLDTKIWGVQSS